MINIIIKKNVFSAFRRKLLENMEIGRNIAQNPTKSKFFRN